MIILIKIDTTKGKSINFNLNIEGGNINEISEGRFLVKHPDKNYFLQFEVKILKDSVIIDVPPLDISGKTDAVLEIISNDKQYYKVWESEIQFSRELNITVSEAKTSPIVSLKEDENNNEKNSKEKVVKENKKFGSRILYRTIKSNQEDLTKVINSNNFKLKASPNKKLNFYSEASFLVKDIEKIDYGLCVMISVPEQNIISEKFDKVIVKTDNLPDISKKDIIYTIENGILKQRIDEISEGQTSSDKEGDNIES